MKYIFKASAVSTCIFLTGGVSHNTLADQNQLLEEVIVTARKKEESIQDVPVTIQAITSAKIERYNLDTIADYATRIPNFNVMQGAAGGSGRMDLRGIGTSGQSAAFESAVSVNVDDVMFNSARVTHSSYFDLAGVEVLKGPQSLYFGRSATAGVLTIKSANPTEEVAASITTSYESEEDGYVVEGFLSGPLTDTLLGRVAFRKTDTKEFVSNKAENNSNKLGEENKDIRITFQWDPTDRLSANFKLSRSELYSDDPLGRADVDCRGATASPSAWPPFVYAFGLSIQPIPTSLDCKYDDGKYYIYAGNPIEDANFIGNTNNGKPFLDMDTDIARLKLDYDLTDNFSLTSVTSYYNMEANDFQVFLLGAPYGANQYQTNRTESFAQEFRLEGSVNDRMDFMIGAYYQERNILADQEQNPISMAQTLDIFSNLSPSDEAILISALGFNPGYPGGLDPVTGYSSDYRKVAKTDSETQSVFGSLNFHATDRLDITAGVRYTKEKKSMDLSVPYIHTYLNAFIANGLLYNGFRLPEVDFDDENFSPELSFTYALTPDINLFGAYKTGFKAGGIDTSVLVSGSLVGLAASGNFEDLTFDSETGKGFEFGIKSDLLENTLRLNSTIFRYVYEDLQVQQFNNAILQFRTYNAGEATTQGLELDFEWLTPVDGLVFYGALGFTDATYTKDFINLNGVNLKDKDLVGNAKWSGNIGADYYLPIGRNLQLGLTALAAFKDKYRTNDSDPNVFIQDAYWTFDLGVSLGDQSEKWLLSLVANNVTDEIYATGAQSGVRLGSLISPAGLGDLDILNSRGRQLTLKFTYNF